MANYDAVLHDTQKRFDRVYDGTTIPQQMITINLLSNDKLKDPYKVIKNNEITRHMTNVEVVIVFNELLLEQLDNDQRDMIMDEALARVEVNHETGAVKCATPDVNTFSGVILKYGGEAILKLKECIRAAKDVKKNDDAQTEKA